MQAPMFRAIGTALIASASIGCATMAGMRTEPLDAGVAKEYTTDLRTAVSATRNALPVEVDPCLVSRRPLSACCDFEMLGTTDNSQLTIHGPQLNSRS